MTAAQRKPYPAYKPSGVEWLGDVPEHWEVKRGRFCMRINPISDRLRRLTQDDEISFVPMDNVGENGGLRLDITRVFGDIASSYTEFQDGDVVVAKITPCFENGKGALVSGLTNGVALGTTELHVLRVGAGIDRRFLFYLTISSVYRKSGEAEMYGAGGQKRVPPEFNKNFRTPVPPITEQRAIADFLDRETGKIDRLMAKKRELIEKLKEERAALISRAVTSGIPSTGSGSSNPDAKLISSGIEWLGDIPKHWSVCAVWHVYFLGRGRVISHEDIRENPGEYPVYSSQTENNGILGCLGTYDFEGDYITWTTDGANAGTVFRRHGRFNCTNVCGTLKAKSKESIDNRFTTYALNLATNEFVRHDINPKLMNNVMAKIRFGVPPLSEQITIANHLDLETGKIDRFTAKVEEAIERLQEYRAALITAGVTGKIDVSTSLNAGVREAGNSALEYPESQAACLKAAEKGTGYS